MLSESVLILIFFIRINAYMWIVQIIKRVGISEVSQSEVMILCLQVVIHGALRQMGSNPVLQLHLCFHLKLFLFGYGLALRQDEYCQGGFLGSNNVCSY